MNKNCKSQLPLNSEVAKRKKRKRASIEHKQKQIQTAHQANTDRNQLQKVAEGEQEKNNRT